MSPILPRLRAERRRSSHAGRRSSRVSRQLARRRLQTSSSCAPKGIAHRHKRRHRPEPPVHQDLVQRRFVATGPDRLWCTDHRTAHRGRKGYCCAVLDMFSRQVVGWSIADHVRSDLVVEALQMATWRRRPAAGTIVHSDRSSQGGFSRSSQRGAVILTSFCQRLGGQGGSEAELGEVRVRFFRPRASGRRYDRRPRRGCLARPGITGLLNPWGAAPAAAAEAGVAVVAGGAGGDLARPGGGVHVDGNRGQLGSSYIDGLA
jgi:hypothetical protein